MKHLPLLSILLLLAAIVLLLKYERMNGRAHHLVNESMFPPKELYKDPAFSWEEWRQQRPDPWHVFSETMKYSAFFNCGSYVCFVAAILLRIFARITKRPVHPFIRWPFIGLAIVYGFLLYTHIFFVT
jgi:hypothetical protein